MVPSPHWLLIYLLYTRLATIDRLPFLLWTMLSQKVSTPPPPPHSDRKKMSCSLPPYIFKYLRVARQPLYFCEPI